MLTRLLILFLLSILAFSTLLPGCGSDDDPTATAEGKVQLVYQDWRTDWFPPMAQEMLDEFHATHPNIQVFYIPDPENYHEEVLNDFLNGTAPDVFQGCCTHFPAWAQKGYTLDLAPYVEADLDQSIIDDWSDAQYEAFITDDGMQFGLPKYHGALALYYNKDLFDEYGVEYPDDTWTYGDYLSAMEELTHDMDGDGQTDVFGSMLDISWDRIQVHVNAWGGHFVDPEDKSKCLMCDEESMEAMEWIRARIWDDRVMASFLDVQNLSTRDAFINQKVAMVEDGSWALKDILSGADFRIGVAPLPEGPARRATLASTDGFGIYAGTNHPDEAWELVKFLISKDYGRAMAQVSFLQPARASLVEDWIGFIRQEFPEKAADVDLAAFADGHIKGYSVTAEICPDIAAVKEIVDEAWEEIFTLGRAPTESMNDVCRQIEELHNTGE